ncbi:MULTISPECIES: hypothetical protein [unclassified Bradyrhizobium]|uniref:hypothetical protein n=1 Tax=unclassified Bradyrhizobium TaxID=2631580 RepID=UPI0003A4D9F6|nr:MULTISPECIES: hypothetical protein [unclassified Bradyrhizobium]MBB4361618.1 hypothetical protein [Bradyrhizobium sp. CIR18]MBB4376054.1 hypothetical protein [Bradyrhizobium sp. SBR1B]MBB4392597.1 hypothetical protein [Bradyrhizobium sp. ERR14]
MKMSIGGLVVSMPEQVRLCENIPVAVGEHIDCLMRNDETRKKFFAPVFPDGFAD